ncbi:MAG: hypothetical protein LUC90_11530 [Lachnospiraceae bacterium]|nr:hypothetical protein [Lachnospiraceae bacterium]
MYIIFICDFDLFGYGKYRYTFQNTCREVERLVLPDEVSTVFLNTQGSNPEEVEPELVEFLKFLKDNTGKNTNEYNDNRVRKTYDKIKRLKTIAEMEVDYMASSWWLIEEKEKAHNEGEEKMAELVRRLYEAGRNEDALRAATDKEYRRKLYEELGI